MTNYYLLLVLENVTLSTGNSAKLVSSSGKTLDLSKITVFNSINPVKAGGGLGNVLLLPDGKLKTIPAVKSTGTVTAYTSANHTISSTQTATSTTVSKPRKLLFFF